MLSSQVSSYLKLFSSIQKIIESLVLLLKIQMKRDHYQAYRWSVRYVVCVLWTYRVTCELLYECDCRYDCECDKWGVDRVVSSDSLELRHKLQQDRFHCHWILVYGTIQDLTALFLFDTFQMNEGAPPAVAVASILERHLLDLKIWLEFLEDECRHV